MRVYCPDPPELELAVFGRGQMTAIAVGIAKEPSTAAVKAAVFMARLPVCFAIN